MEKPAETKFPVHELIKRRWSPRAFDPKPVDKALLGSLLEAARWAASSRNEQPWRLILGIKGQDDGHAKLVECLMAGNLPWAASAPVLMLVSAHTVFAHNGQQNPHCLYDCGLAMGNFTTQATASGLWLHQMAGFETTKARTTFALPETWHPVAMIALGYQGDAAALPEPKRAQELAPRTRKPLTEIVFLNNLQTPWQA